MNSEVNPAEWDCCDEHESTFPIGDECPQCVRAETGHFPGCGVGERTQRGPCDCSTERRDERTGAGQEKQ